MTLTIGMDGQNSRLGSSWNDAIAYCRRLYGESFTTIQFWAALKQGRK